MVTLDSVCVHAQELYRTINSTVHVSIVQKWAIATQRCVAMHTIENKLSDNFVTTRLKYSICTSDLCICLYSALYSYMYMYTYLLGS